MSPSRPVSSYLTLFTLTSAAQKTEILHVKTKAVYVSVALFLHLRAVAVSNYRVLCCPDFPLAITGQRLYRRASPPFYHSLLILANLDFFNEVCYNKRLPCSPRFVYCPIYFRVRLSVLLSWHMRKTITLQFSQQSQHVAMHLP